MSISTSLSPSVRRPLTSHEFLYSSGSRSLVPVPRRIALIGIKSSAGTLAAATPTEVFDSVTSDTLAGVGSELALMARSAFGQFQRMGRSCALSLVAVAEPGAGTARIVTLTVTGPATASGLLIYRIAGRPIAIGVTSGDSADTVAAALEAAIDAAAPILPLTSSVAAAVITCTLRYKGANGSDVTFRQEQGVAGIAIAYAESAAGAGTVDLTASLDVLTGKYDGIAVANGDANDVSDLLAHLAACNTPTAKKWRRAWLFEPSTVAAATVHAGSFNNVAAMVLCCEGAESLPGELAAATAALYHTATRPNPNLNGAQIVGFPPVAANAFTDTEQETALGVGVSPFLPVTNGLTGSVVDGLIKIVKLTTTKTLDGATPVEWPRLPCVSQVGWAIAEQIDAKFVERFGPDANPDGALADGTALGRVRDLICDVLYTAEEAKWVKNVDDTLPAIQTEIDGTIATRINAALEYVPVPPLDQAAFVHRVSQSVTLNR